VNIRLQKYKKNRILGMSQYNAALAAGYSKAMAKSHTKELEERAKITDVLERQGLTDKCLAIKVLELVEASDIVIIEGVEMRVNRPNWPARAKGLELALRLKDLLRDKIEHSGLPATETKIIIVYPEGYKKDGSKTEAVSSRLL